MARPSWDETWMNVAQVISHRSICAGRAIGAVIVDSSNRPISSGYNGPPRGFDTRGATDCREFCPRSRKAGQDLPDDLRCGKTSEDHGRCVKAHDHASPHEYRKKLSSYDDCYTIHAEANAIIFADRRTFEGGTLYVTSVPCWECAKIIANSGIKRVVFVLDPDLDAHRDPDRTIRFLDQCGLEFTIYHLDAVGV